jgi:hypothetical protein
MYRPRKPEHATEGLCVNKRYALASRLLCAALVLCAGRAFAQSPEARTAGSRSDAADAMTLGPQQAALDALLGSWEVAIILSDGSKLAQHSKGLAEYSWSINGPWLGCHLTGKILGAPYEQFANLRYDSYAKNIGEGAVECADNSMLLSRGPTAGPD